MSPTDFQNYILGIRAPNTAEAYYGGAIRFEKWMKENNLEFSTLTPGVLSDFASDLGRKKKAPASVHLWTVGASRYLKWRKRSGDSIPEIYDAEMPIVRYPDPKAMTAEDLIKFLQAANNQKEPWRTAMMLLPFCGLRGMEITKLRLSDIHVQKNPDGVRVIFRVEGKGGKVREVLLMKKGRKLLKHYLDGWRSEVGGEYLFPKPSGDPISRRSLRDKFKIIRGQTGIDGLKAHKCRRTWSTALGEMGVSDIEIAKLMGHSSVDTLMKHYKEFSLDSVARKIG